MWKCSACQNENKDEYRFCLNCGNPRPSADGSASEEDEIEEEEGGRRSGLITTVLLLLLAVIIVIAIAIVILFFPRLKSEANDRRQAETEQSASRRERDVEGEDADSDGTSTFIFGNENINAPAASHAPEAAATAEPTTAPTPTQEPVTTVNSDYLIPDSNSRYLTEADLKNLTQEQCCLARNEIFARHGRIFSTPQIAAYFEGKSWYHGTLTAANFDDSVFNAFERANISFISQYETSHWGGSYY